MVAFWFGWFGVCVVLCCYLGMLYWLLVRVVCVVLLCDCLFVWVDSVVIDFACLILFLIFGLRFVFCWFAYWFTYWLFCFSYLLFVCLRYCLYLLFYVWVGFVGCDLFLRFCLIWFVCVFKICFELVCSLLCQLAVFVLVIGSILLYVVFGVVYYLVVLRDVCLYVLWLWCFVMFCGGCLVVVFMMVCLDCVLC